MTKEEWSRVRNALTMLNNPITLKIDGYEVTVALVRVSAMKNAIAIYVNGKFQGKWMVEDCEERRRFIQKRTKSFFTPKKLKEMGIPKKEHRGYLKEKYEYYQIHWTSFGGLKAHLIQNDESIELVKIEGE